MLIRCCGIEAEFICRSGLYLKCGSWEAWIECCGYSKERGHNLIHFRSDTARYGFIPVREFETWKVFIYKLEITIDRRIAVDQRERLEGHIYS